MTVADDYVDFFPGAVARGSDPLVTVDDGAVRQDLDGPAEALRLDVCASPYRSTR